MKEQPGFLDVPVARVMTRRPDIVAAEAPLSEAAGLMVSGGYRHLPVVDPDGRLVGMLSERDLRGRLGSELDRFADAGRQLLAETVESVARPDPIAIHRDAPLRAVLESLIDDRVGALPVTDDRDRPVGIVSYVDLLAYLREKPPESRRRPGARPRPAAARSRKRGRGARRVRRRGGARGTGAPARSRRRP